MINAKNGRKGPLTPGMRPVDEGTRIDITKVIADFQSSDDTEHRFPPTLTNHERAIVHNECKKYGMVSKSFGKGANRAVQIFKRKNSWGGNSSFQFQLGRETASRIDKYLRSFPPSRREIQSLVEEAQLSPEQGNVLTKSYSVENGAQQIRAQNKAKPSKGARRAIDLTPEEIQSRVNTWKAWRSSKAGEKLGRVRENLPIAAFKHEILEAISTNQVVLIAGETGCGKTTQVPQYILEHSWESGNPCRVLCTQPRRISATSVAERIAAERGESIGTTVGYTIRLDRKGGEDCSIMFCTNGIMLRMVTSDKEDTISSVTHIVVDEVHERDRFADFMLIIIRDLLPKHPHLKLILMSATLHEELYSSYFGSCPVVRVPGFTFPVQDLYLEDVLKITGYQEAALRELKSELGNDFSINFNNKGSELPNERRMEIENAIELAFKRGTDEDFAHLLEVTGAQDAGENLIGMAPGIDVQHPESGATALIAASFRGRGDVASVLLANGASVHMKAVNGMDAAACAAQFGHKDLANLLTMHAKQSNGIEDITNAALALSHYQQNTDQEEVDIGLIEELLMYICQDGKHKHSKLIDELAAIESDKEESRAILVFLPGWDEIIRLKDILEKSRVFGDQNRYRIVALHSMVAPEEQKKAFVRPPTPIRKIILATNIAETAITIDDVVCVIDSGRQKEKSFDPYTGVSTLQSTWISKASAKQRRGRAGRCRPGVAFHIYSRQRNDAMVDFGLPELMRTPLDEMGLQVKLLERENSSVSIAEFLGKAVEPPVRQAVESAIKLLEKIGAIEEETEKLTVLGRHLASLPISPLLGKMLLYGVMFDCLDPVLTVACCLAYRDPWVVPASADGRQQASSIRRRFSEKASGASDQMATIRAYNEWKEAKMRGEDWGFCTRNFLNPATLRMLDGMRTQLLGELAEKGFVQSLENSSKKANKTDIVRCVLACGFYPNIGRLAGNARNDKKSKAAMVSQQGERVRIHPSSINCTMRNEIDDSTELGRVTLLFYDEMTRGDSIMYVKSCTEVKPHPVMLVASHMSLMFMPLGNDQRSKEISDSVGSINLEDAFDVQQLRADTFFNDTETLKSYTAILTLDGWLHYKMPAMDAIYLSLLRIRVAAAFAHKAMHPRKKLPDGLFLATGLVSNIFQKDGINFTRGDNSASFERTERRNVMEKYRQHGTKRNHSHGSARSFQQKKPHHPKGNNNA